MHTWKSKCVSQVFMTSCLTSVINVSYLLKSPSLSSFPDNSCLWYSSNLKKRQKLYDFCFCCIAGGSCYLWQRLCYDIYCAVTKSFLQLFLTHSIESIWLESYHLEGSGQLLTLLHSLHSLGIPRHLSPKLAGKQVPLLGPARGGPT